nr:type I polyketide synthase [Amycolatopsis aidingensis]
MRLSELGVSRFLELGPDGSLCGVLDGGVAVPVLRREWSEEESAVRALARLYVAGVPVDWAGFFAGMGARVVDLPTYAFQHQHFWPASSARPADATGLGLDTAAHPLLGARTAIADSSGVLFTGRLSTATHPWLADHQVAGSTLLPGTALLELALRAGEEVGCRRIAELTLLTPLPLAGHEAVHVQVWVGAEDEPGSRPIGIHTRPADEPEREWTQHVSGRLATGERLADFGPGEWPPAGATALDLTGLYDRAAVDGFDYGPVFRGLRAAWQLGTEVFAEVALPDQVRDAETFGLHPALLDAALHAMPFAFPDGPARPGLPFRWEGASLHAVGAAALRVRITPRAEGKLAVTAVDPEGTPVLSVDSLTLRAPAEMTATAGRAEPLFTVAWSPLPPASTAEPTTAVLGDGLDSVPDPVPDLVLLDLTGAEAEEVVPVTHQQTARVLGLAQQWLDEERFAHSRLVVVTRGALDGADPAAAAVGGLLRSAAAEHPGRFVLLDTASADDIALALPQLASTDEPQLAVRDGEVCAGRLRRTLPDPGPAWDPEGVVLLTGGTGGVGRELARHLAQQGFRHLVLAGRRGPAAEGARDLIRELADLGAEARLVACDLGDRTAVHELVEQAGVERPLTAVVHAAGVTDDGVLAFQSPERLSTVLGPKADGAWYLHEATRGVSLAGFVLFSSAAGVFGTAGQGNYAAANAFLDGLAGLRRAEGLPGLSLAWGAWATGMAAGMADVDRERMARTGFRPLEIAEGLALFDRATGTDATCLVTTRWIPAPCVRFLRCRHCCGNWREFSGEPPGGTPVRLGIWWGCCVGCRWGSGLGCCWMWCVVGWGRCWGMGMGLWWG